MMNTSPEDQTMSVLLISSLGATNPKRKKEQDPVCVDPTVGIIRTNWQKKKRRLISVVVIWLLCSAWRQNPSLLLFFPTWGTELFLQRSTLLFKMKEVLKNPNRVNLVEILTMLLSSDVMNNHNLWVTDRETKDRPVSGKKCLQLCFVSNRQNILFSSTDAIPFSTPLHLRALL